MPKACTTPLLTAHAALLLRFRRPERVTYVTVSITCVVLGPFHGKAHRRCHQWEATQDNLKLTMQRNAFGLHMPVRLMMERQIVGYVRL